MADLKQIKVGSTTYNIEPYTSYLPLAGGTMTGNIKWGGATQEILSFAPTNADWRGGLKYSWSSNTTIGIWGRHAMSQFVWHAGADFASADVNGTTTKTYDFQIGRSVATGSTIVRTSGDLSVAGGATVGGSMDANSARISNGLYVGTSITHKEGENLLIGNSSNNDYVYIVEDMQASNESWSLNQNGDLSIIGILEAQSGFKAGGNSDITGDLTVSGGKVYTQGGLSSAGDLQADGDVKIGGQIVGPCLLNPTEVKLSSSNAIHIPLNASRLTINSSTTYIHRGPTGTYIVVFPSRSCEVVTSSITNMGSATYRVGSTTATASNLSGTAHGGGSSYQAGVDIPTKNLSVYLTYGSSYTISVSYTKASHVTSIKTYGTYAAEEIYALTTVSTSPNGTIAIGISDTVYRGQTNIGGESNTSYEITLGAAGKTYTYLSSPTATWSYTSDKRDKTDIELINSSLHFINKLQPVTYVENMRESYINEDGTFNQESHQMGVLKKHRRRAGFLAQDVYELLKKEYGTDNYASVVDYNRYKKEDEGVFDRYSFNGVQLIPFLVKAIQEQQEIIKSLDEKINLLEEKINEGAN